MGRALALFTYKMRFFFGPSIRGRFGPLAYVALILIFLPSGFFTGYGIGVSIRTAETSAAIAGLCAPHCPVPSLGPPCARWPCVTALAPEYELFLTSPKPPPCLPIAGLSCPRFLP